jgi:hypothetical protein
MAELIYFPVQAIQRFFFGTFSGKNSIPKYTGVQRGNFHLGAKQFSDMHRSAQLFVCQTIWNTSSTYLYGQDFHKLFVALPTSLFIENSQ